MKKNLFITALCTITSFAATAQIAGSLDTTFNGNGIYTYDFGFHDNLNDVTMQPDQKIICSGVAISSGFSGVVLKVIRLKTDGTPDSTFATNGVYSLLIGNEAYGYESYVQPDGKIIVAGLTYDLNYQADWLLLRLDSAGALDSTFGTNGITMVDFFNTDDIAQALTVQPDGKILVAGTYLDTINYFNNPTIMRFTADGIIDSTFGTNGIVSVAGIDIDNELTSISVQQDGKIVAGGHFSKVFTGSMDFDVLVIRVDSAGVLDPTFGVNGVVKTSINGGIDDSFGLETDADGNVFVAGFTTLPVTLFFDMILLKYDSTGTLDPAFGNGGIVTFNNSEEDVAYDLKIQADNKIVVGGSSGLDFFGPRDFAIWRYLPNGTPDNTFGINGFVTTTVLPNFQDCNSIALQADGKIVAAGKAYNGSQNDIAVARYLNDVSTTINEITNDPGILLYPNPTMQNQVVTIFSENPVKPESRIEIFSLAGNKIAVINDVNASHTGRAQFTIPPGIAAGIYFISFHNGHQHTTAINTPRPSTHRT